MAKPAVTPLSLVAILMYWGLLVVFVCVANLLFFGAQRPVARGLGARRTGSDLESPERRFRFARLAVGLELDKYERFSVLLI